MNPIDRLRSINKQEFCELLVKADMECDRIPVACLVTNVINVIIRLSVKILASDKTIKENQYFDYIESKTFTQIFLSGIQIYKWLHFCCPPKEWIKLMREDKYKAWNGSDKNMVMNCINKVQGWGEDNFFNMVFWNDSAVPDHVRYRGYYDEHWDVSFNSARALKFASRKLKADKEVVLAAINKDYRALKYADPVLLDDKEIVLQALFDAKTDKKEYKILKLISKRLKNDEDVLTIVGDEEKIVEMKKKQRNAVLENAKDKNSRLNQLPPDLVREIINYI